MRNPRASQRVPGLGERLRNGERILVAEGYLFEMERRGYLKSGPYVPECVLDHPTQVALLHEEFAHAGSDVVQAFTYYANRDRLRLIGREGDLESLNRKALRMAKNVATEEGRLMAGCLSNTSVFSLDDPETHNAARDIFREQVQWAVEEGADYIIGETFTDLAEAKIALGVIKELAPRLDCVMTFTKWSASDVTRDGFSLAEACATMEEMGATATGLNCSVGPREILASMEGVRVACRGPLAALPVPYRTTPEQPLMQQLTLPDGAAAFPQDLDYFSTTLSEVAEFGRAAERLGIAYVGLCCGNSARFFRALAEGPTLSRDTLEHGLIVGLGREPAASAFGMDGRQATLPLRLRTASIDFKANVHVGI